MTYSETTQFYINKAKTYSVAQAFNMTPAQVCEYYDSHPNITLKQLSTITGKTVSYLKGLLLA